MIKLKISVITKTISMIKNTAWKIQSYLQMSAGLQYFE